MSETWVGCPLCGLKHRMRAEGTCPRCQASVVPGAAGGGASAAVAMPAVALAADPSGTAETASDDTTVGGLAPLRWAGIVMLANVALSMLEVGLLRHYMVIEAQEVSGRLPSVVIDAVLGTFLVMGQEKHRNLAMLRAILGGLVFTGMRLFQGDIITAVVQVILSASLITLLSEAPPRGRVKLALGATLGLFLLQGLGIHLLIQADRSAFAAERNSREIQRFMPGR